MLVENGAFLRRDFRSTTRCSKDCSQVSFELDTQAISSALFRISVILSITARITFATASQAEVIFPSVIYRPISEADAWIEVCFAWNLQSEEAAVGRVLTFMRDEARSRCLL